jgi:hypothetical protein
MDRTRRVGVSPLPRPVAVDGVGDEYSGAHDAEERGDCFQHGDNPKTQRGNLTSGVATQSKEFRENLNFESWMMILCNRLRQAGTTRPRRGRSASWNRRRAARQLRLQTTLLKPSHASETGWQAFAAQKR